MDSDPEVLAENCNAQLLTGKSVAEMGNSLEDLANVRKDLLRAAAAAWIHDMGKCDDRHIEKSASDGNKTIQYNYKTHHLSKVSNIQLNLLKESVSFDELIEQGRPEHFQDSSKPLLVRLLGLCHGVAHTEKADLIYDSAKQKTADTRLSTPFGHEFEPLKGLQKKLAVIDFNAITTTPLDFMREVRVAFGDTVGETRRPLNDVSLSIWSHTVAAFYKAALASVVLGYQSDLSKLHWRLLSVRFNGLQFLENVDRISDLLARQKLLKDGLGKVRELLEVSYPLGTEVYRDENGSIFIVPDRDDLLKLQDQQGKTLCQLILDKFSSGTVPKKESQSTPVQLGGEVVPDVQLHEPWPPKGGPLGQEPWKDKKNLNPPPPLPLDQQLLRIPTNRASFHGLNEWWSGNIEDTCNVCHVRPQGWRASVHSQHHEYQAKGKTCPPVLGCQLCKTLERKVCAICEERREDRSEQWAGDLKSTIWIDEVADANGRVALIAGRFGLEHWLDGQTVFYPPSREKKSFKFALLDVKCVGGRSVGFDQGKKNYTWIQATISPSTIEEGYIPKRFRASGLQIATPPKQKVKVTDVRKVSEEDYCITLDQILWGFVPNDLCRISRGIFRVVGDGSQVETTDEGSRWVVREQILQPDELLVERDVKLYPMEEAQTPARLYRACETTLQFWQDLQAEPGVGEVSLRLRIRVALPETELRAKLARFHAYELKLHNINLSIAKVADEEFITIDNLQRIAILLDPSKVREYREDYEKAASYIDEQLQELCRANKPIEVEEPTGYGSANRTLGMLHITKVEPEKTPYVPAIPILTEPRTFMALVPADKALSVVGAIKKKYEDEMGKVRNRLPVSVGIVFAGLRTPLPAILDAGRRMLQQQTKATEWWAKKVDKSSYPEKVVLDLEREEVQISLTVKAVMDDGITEDTWYSWWCIAKERDILRPRKEVFTSRDGKNWVLIRDLQEGDTVSFMPSRLDFEFLDTASRRFEISYNTGGKRHGTQHPARPYYLEQLDEFKELWELLSRGLEATQIHAFIGMIEEKRSEWLDGESRKAEKSNEVFQQAVCDALRNANWKEGAKPTKIEFERLQKAALSGQLADVFELYMRILKKGENE